MTKPNDDFGKRLQELESITAWFESDESDLDQALAKFEQGMELAAGLKADLRAVENRVEKIKAKFDRPTATESMAEDVPLPPAPDNLL